MNNYYTDKNDLNRKIITIHPQIKDIYYDYHNLKRFIAGIEENLATPSATPLTKILGSLLLDIDDKFGESYNQGSYSGRFWSQIGTARDELALSYYQARAKFVAVLLEHLAVPENSSVDIKQALKEFAQERLDAFTAPQQTCLKLPPVAREQLNNLVVNWIDNPDNEPRSDATDSTWPSKVAAAGLEKYFIPSALGELTPGTPHLQIGIAQPLKRADVDAFISYNELQEDIAAVLTTALPQIHALTSAQSKFSAADAAAYPVITPVKCRLLVEQAKIKELPARGRYYTDEQYADFLAAGYGAVRKHSAGSSQGRRPINSVLYVNNINNLEFFQENIIRREK